MRPYFSGDIRLHRPKTQALHTVGTSNQSVPVAWPVTFIQGTGNSTYMLQPWKITNKSSLNWTCSLQCGAPKRYKLVQNPQEYYSYMYTMNHGDIGYCSYLHQLRYSKRGPHIVAMFQSSILMVLSIINFINHPCLVKDWFHLPSHTTSPCFNSSDFPHGLSHIFPRVSYVFPMVVPMVPPQELSPRRMGNRIPQS